MRNVSNSPLHIACVIAGLGISTPAIANEQSSIPISRSTISQFDLAIEAYKRREFDTAIHLLRALGEAGDARAQFYLGRMHYFGFGLPPDYTAALKWFKSAADQGHAKAQKYLGDMYLRGRGVAVDLAAASRWYDKAAQQGDADGLMMQALTSDDPAVINSAVIHALRAAADQGDDEAKAIVGWRYFLGLGTQRKRAEGLQLLREAAAKGNAQAQWRLGDAYSGNEGVPRDNAVAANWYRIAAENGNNEAQRSLGKLYAEGKGVPKDPIQAYKWLTVYVSRPTSDPEFTNIVMEMRDSAATVISRAQLDVIQQHWRTTASHGDAQAEMIMGWMYESGAGVTRDKVEAIRWYRMAADRGDREAQFLLGYIYADGEFGSEGRIEAYKWLSLYASGYETDRLMELRERAMDLRDSIASKMDSAEISRAQNLVIGWQTGRI